MGSLDLSRAWCLKASLLLLKAFVPFQKAFMPSKRPLATFGKAFATFQALESTSASAGTRTRTLLKTGT